MKFSAENPRYTAYTNSAYGYVEVGTANRKAAAWKLADEAAKHANLDNWFSSWAEIHDAARNGMSFRVGAAPKTPAYLVVTPLSGATLGRYATKDRAFDALKHLCCEMDLAPSAAAVMTEKQWEKYVGQCQRPGMVEDEARALVSQIVGYNF